MIPAQPKFEDLYKDKARHPKLNLTLFPRHGEINFKKKLSPYPTFLILFSLT